MLKVMAGLFIYIYFFVFFFLLSILLSSFRSSSSFSCVLQEQKVRNPFREEGKKERAPDTRIYGVRVRANKKWTRMLKFMAGSPDSTHTHTPGVLLSLSHIQTYSLKSFSSSIDCFYRFT